MPRHATLLRLSGHGGSRQAAGFWLPLAWELHLIPASDFVFLARTSFAGVRLGRLGEELRDGRGRYRAGRRILDGDAVDRAEHATLWAWTLVLAPLAVLDRADVFVEAAGAERVRVSFPYGTETWECGLTFGADGLLRRLDTHREHIGSGGGTLRFAIEVERFAAQDGRPAPDRLVTRWGDVPSLRLDVDSHSVEA